MNMYKRIMAAILLFSVLAASATALMGCDALTSQEPPPVKISVVSFTKADVTGNKPTGNTDNTAYFFAGDIVKKCAGILNNIEAIISFARERYGLEPVYPSFLSIFALWDKDAAGPEPEETKSAGGEEASETRPIVPPVEATPAAAPATANSARDIVITSIGKGVESAFVTVSRNNESFVRVTVFEGVIRSGDLPYSVSVTGTGKINFYIHVNGTLMRIEPVDFDAR